MSVNGRAKGKRGELELCHYLKTLFGWHAERSQQYSGNAGTADVLIRQLPMMFVECKRVQNLNLHEAVGKAVDQAEEKLPAVFHRKNNHPWLLTIRLSDLNRLVEMVKSVRSTPQGP